MSCIGFSVYAIKHRASGRVYIGSTIQCLTARFREHLSRARRGNGSRLHRAIRKYGADAFSIEKVASSWSGSTLRGLELDVITQRKSVAYGYNSSAFLYCSPGYKLEAAVDLSTRKCMCHRPLHGVGSSPLNVGVAC